MAEDESPEGSEAGAAPTAPEAPPPAQVAPAPDYKDLFLRASAELDNYRKRVDREKATLLSFASEGVVRRLLEPFDSFGRAIADLVRVQADAPREVKASIARSLDGLRALERQLKELLAGEGVEAINAVGAEFDPAFHEALVRVPHPTAPEGTVVEVLQPGYTMRDKVLRPARVSVSNGPFPSTKTGDLVASPAQDPPASPKAAGKNSQKH